MRLPDGKSWNGRSSMTDRIALLALFQERTGRTTTTPTGEADPNLIHGYQRSRFDVRMVNNDRE